MDSFRKRLPVAAKIALVTAGMMVEVPASPNPPGNSWLRTMCTSTFGDLVHAQDLVAVKVGLLARPFLTVMLP